MYRHTPQYTWAEWEQPEGQVDGPDYSGFRAKILKNPNASEVRAEAQAFLDWINPQKKGSGPDDYYPVIAYRVIAWEFERMDDDGEIVAVPAPGEQPNNWQAFLLMPPDLAGWLIRQVRTAHLPKATTQPLPPAGTTEPTTQSATVPATVLPAS